MKHALSFNSIKNTPQIQLDKYKSYVYLLEVHPLRRSNFDVGPDKENAIGRESDDIVEEPLVNVDDLQNVAGSGSKQVGLLYDEQLLFLRGPQQSPRSRKRRPGGDAILAQSGQCVYGLDDGVPFLRVALGLEALVLVRYEVEEFLLGEFRLGCEGRAGDLWGARVVIRAAGLWSEASIWKEDIRRHENFSTLLSESEY